METWLRTDRRHRGALLQAQAALHAIETAVVHGPSVLASDNDANYGQARRSGFQRRRLAIGAIAACFLAVIFVEPARLWLTTPDPIAAPAVLDLADGSIVTLGGGAEVTVQLTDHARTVTLESSQAVFNVAKDAKRPFVVRSGEVFAQALGTVYSVTRVGTRGALINVSEGSVLVWADGKADQAIALTAGDQLTLDPGAPMTQAQDPGKISLDNESILAASKRFNRVNGIQIVVEDPTVGDVRIVGLFKANDPEQFAKAAAIVAGAQVIHRDGQIILQGKGSAVTKN
ncbi:FecR family protein [Luteimonas sp. A277]